mmetsp:Transcript_59513/g.81799  ORF Transcript_59513/g.81799 Transcript_59513/m.81799 type:complete len:97 (+) Transcript_59513:2353-2643(+)
MRDSIGGNSKTLMFVNISPADYNSRESATSLYFGQNVKQIKNDVSKNVQTEEMLRLKEENAALKKMVGTSTGHTLKTTATTAHASKLKSANTSHVS